MRTRACYRRCNPSWIQVADRLTGNEARRLAEKYERMGYAARITGTSSFTLLVMKTNRAKKFWSGLRGNPGFGYTEADVRDYLMDIDRKCRHAVRSAKTIQAKGCAGRALETCERARGAMLAGRYAAAYAMGTEALRTLSDVWISNPGRRCNPSRRRRNPDIEALSWPTAWGTGGKSKKDFKAYVAAHGGDAEVMCHGMRSVPGSLRDLPRKRYVVYGGTSNPNQIPAKWYATIDLTGSRPKVS